MMHRGYTLIEVMIAASIIATAMVLSTEFLSAATRHDMNASSQDEVEADIERIRTRLASELSSTAWMFPGSDPNSGFTTATVGYERALTNGTLTTDILEDQGKRYWPYVVAERIPRASGPASTMPYVDLHPDVRLNRAGWTRFRDRIPGMAEQLAGGPAMESTPSSSELAVMPSQTAVDTIAKRDLDSAYRPNRHLVWLSILHDAWHQDPLKIQPPVLRMGESQWADWSTWTATAPASRWDNLALIKVAPISTQLETTSGSGVWDTVPDALRFDITDGGGTSINVGTLPVPRAAGWPMISSILRIENGGASYDVIPQWDTILQPDFKAEDKDHNKWRDRGLFLIRSPLTPFGRLVIAAKMPAVTAAGTVPIGTGVGNRISRYEDGDDNAFIIISVLSDRVLRLTADTWRTAMEPGSDLSVTADATASVHDITIRIWFANEDRSVPDGITLRRASFTIAMRGKTSERSMADDRSAVTRLKRRDLTR